MNSKGNILEEKEVDRINSLKKYELLDSPRDERLDRITSYAATLFNVPISLISFVDENRIWFKSKYGFDINELPREAGLCGLAIQSDDVFVIENAVLDPRTIHLPWVKSAKPYCFYAAAPLKMADGNNVGTLCIVAENPRSFSSKDELLLKKLAKITVDQIEEQISLKSTTKKFSMFLKTAAHELKNPLASIPLWAQLIQEESKDLKITQLANHIQRQSKRMTQLISDLLETVHMGSDEEALHLLPINLSSIVARIAAANIELANKKGQKIFLSIENDMVILGDEMKISEVVDNLINNAIKYSGNHKNINVHLKEDSRKAILQIIDQGPGFTKEDFIRVFEPFSKLSAQPTADESSTGLGLSIVKQIVEAHHGKVYCKNNTPGPGISFIVELPCQTSV